MTESKDNVTTLVPESREPEYPANLFAFRYYGGLRILAMIVLAISLLRLGETCWDTAVHQDAYRETAKAIIDNRGALSRCRDNVSWFWFERVPEHVQVQRKASELISGRRCSSVLFVGFAWLLVWLTFRRRYAEA